MKSARALLIAIGVVLAAVGVLAMVQSIRFEQLLDLAIWLACAVLLHDGVFVPLTLVFSGLSVRAGRALPAAALNLVQIGFVVGALLTLVVAPEIFAQARGNSNPTILMFDYGIRLVVMWAIIILVVAAGSILIVARTRRKSVPARSTPASE
ncbi:hypothetical protein [Leifsonia sp. Root112D2]|uniref:hypothetical protein n=1 Tax=Leifsonia sp. Root112D2 TaxID=1736426 RepID=UPI0006FB4DB3|nr:hypothetical protein [Leifsonia sp. Root112D2]KQV07653.1 hypothetical protein ASC63_10560 [Leifsonia sp. Root112D2]